MTQIPNPFWTNTKVNLTKPELSVTFNSYNLNYASIQSAEDGKTWDPNDPNHNNLKMAPEVPSKCNKNNIKCCSEADGECEYLSGTCIFDKLDCPTGQKLLGVKYNGNNDDKHQCTDGDRYCGKPTFFTNCPDHIDNTKCQNTQITFCGALDFKNSIQNQT